MVLSNANATVCMLLFIHDCLVFLGCVMEYKSIQKAITINRNDTGITFFSWTPALAWVFADYALLLLLLVNVYVWL